jgi:3-oxoacyl-(acyl-carrier-protein) synthase
LDAPEPAPVGFQHIPFEGGAPPAAGDVRAALCNSFGFGGMNASALFLRV